MIDARRERYADTSVLSEKNHRAVEPERDKRSVEVAKGARRELERRPKASGWREREREKEARERIGD